MFKYKHMRLDQKKIEEAKRILEARTETETIDKALDRVIDEEHERIRRKNIMRRMWELRDRLGKIKEDSAEWVKQARTERNFSR